MLESRYCSYCETSHELTPEFWTRLGKSRLPPHCKKQRSDYNKQYREKNRDKLNKANQQWREDNREQHRALAMASYHRNKEHCIARMGAYRSARIKTDPAFKLGLNLRGRMYRALGGINKTGSGVRDLGCSLQELKQHLESQFEPGMTWENYGGNQGYSGDNTWEVDHILPLANYQITDRGTYRRLAHYTNLRPLWSRDNRSRSNNEAVDIGVSAQ